MIGLAWLFASIAFVGCFALWLRVRSLEARIGRTERVCRNDHMTLLRTLGDDGFMGMPKVTRTTKGDRYGALPNLAKLARRVARLERAAEPVDDAPIDAALDPESPFGKLATSINDAFKGLTKVASAPTVNVKVDGNNVARSRGKR